METKDAIQLITIVETMSLTANNELFSNYLQYDFDFIMQNNLAVLLSE